MSQVTLKDLSVALQGVLRGQERVVELTLTGLMAGGHILLEGVPGLGKTLLLKALARTSSVDFKRIQFTPDLMPSDVTGTRIIEETPEGKRTFRFEPGPVFTHFLLADEINRATPKTQSALLEAMQERQITVGGERRGLPEPFFVMATQNPIEQEGTYPLPEAQLDRFLMKIPVGTPSVQTLGNILRTDPAAALSDLKPLMSPLELLAFMRQAREVPVASHVLDYMACLVEATHPKGRIAVVDQFVRSGASPRGALGLRDAGRALALLRGMDHVSAHLVRELAPAVLGHRLLLGYEARAEGVDAGRILEAVIAAVPDHPSGVAALLASGQG